MNNHPQIRRATYRLILVPTLISLVVTLWRLTGELLRWSESWFNPEAGGYLSIIGITWLAPVFGIYFALELLKTGETPRSWLKSSVWVLLALVVLFVGGGLQESLYIGHGYRVGLVYIWLVGLASAAISYWAWPQLARLLFAYGLAARLPVVVIMALALRGGWGTHYDAMPQGFPEMGLVAKFLWLSLFPQIVFWVGFTIVAGCCFGTLVVAVKSRVARDLAQGPTA